ncbi:MAG: START domain-containing protein [Chthoniobacterales bacterium]
MNASTCRLRAAIFLGVLAIATPVRAGAKDAHEADVVGKNSGNPSAAWTQESSTKDLVIQSRPREGSSLREFRAVGSIAATPATVFAILDNSEAYPSFMPYTSECHVLKREKNSVLAYQRLEIPLVSDRDYTLRSQSAKWLGSDGTIYRIRWAPANDEGPAVKSGVARVNVCEGGWLLEPDGAGATRATYSIFTDSGGALPAFLANNGSRIAIRKVFDAIRKRVKDPQFAAAAAKSDPRSDGAN